MAISCGCGAMAPILVSEDRALTLPSSLVLGMADMGTEPPHLEYYLGYSAHESEAKTQVEEVLRKLVGCTSQGDCERLECTLAWLEYKQQ